MMFCENCHCEIVVDSSDFDWHQWHEECRRRNRELFIENPKSAINPYFTPSYVHGGNENEIESGEKLNE